jgi:hypothetical protein
MTIFKLNANNNSQLAEWTLMKSGAVVTRQRPLRKIDFWSIDPTHQTAELPPIELSNQAEMAPPFLLPWPTDASWPPNWHSYSGCQKPFASSSGR